MMYGQLCTEFYDADKPLASQEEFELYQQEFSKNSLLLEPMCGTGRLLIPLLKEGYHIHGFDNAPVMLECCVKKLESLKLTTLLEQHSIESFSPKEPHDGIIIPLGSFQLLYPRQKAEDALKKFNKWLKPKGKLIMDFFIPSEALYENADKKGSHRNILLATGEEIVLKTKTIVNKQEQLMHMKNHYEKISNGKVIQYEDEDMNILWYYPYEIELLLEKVGFLDIKKLKRNLYGEEYITVIAKKD